MVGTPPITVAPSLKSKILTPFLSICVLLGRFSMGASLTGGKRAEPC